ncbi:MAG: DNA repair protein RadA, partial [Bacteroidales bacterium]|nr:DNA repair protein RadA [Bacteroidales bacterium]
RIAQRIAEAEKLGFKRMLVPEGNIKGLEAAPRRIELVPVARVEAALRELFG